MLIFKKNLLVLPVCLLVGCSFSPVYQRPDTHLPAAYAESLSSPQPDNTLPTIQWWTLFQDPELNRLVSIAEENNTDLRLAVARVDEANALWRGAQSTVMPSINMSLSSNRNKVSAVNAIPLTDTTKTHQSNDSAGLSTNFELDVWGRLHNAREGVQRQLLSRRYAQETVRLTLIAQIAAYYVMVRAYEIKEAVIQDTLQTRLMTLELVQHRFHAGLASLTDVKQAEAAIATAVAQLANLHQQQALATHQLALLTGDTTLVVAPATSDHELPSLPLPPEGLPSALLLSRPDIRQAEEDLQAAGAQVGVMRSALFPTISLTGSLGTASASLSQLFSSAASTWGFGLGVLFPVFDAGRSTALVDQAMAQQQQAAIRYQKSVQMAFKEVRDALSGVQYNYVIDQAQAQYFAVSQDALDLARIRHKAGHTSALELLEARRTVNDARLAFVTSRQTQLNMSIDLFKALGTGWQEEAMSK